MKTLVAIPVYNEQAHVAGVLEQVRHYVSDVLVVDDGSTDATPLLLAGQPVEVIRHARNRGYGRSLIDAFRYAMCQCCAYDWLITMDCDEQHEPSALTGFMDLAARADADVISGSRYLPESATLAGSLGNGAGAPPPDRQEINRVVTKMVNECLGLSITDAFCGYKAYRVAALHRLDLDESGYAFPLQFWVQAAVHDLRIVEMPVALIYNDPKRRFGGLLDDADRRLEHYQEVFRRELAKFPDKLPVCCAE